MACDPLCFPHPPTSGWHRKTFLGSDTWTQDRRKGLGVPLAPPCWRKNSVSVIWRGSNSLNEEFKAPRRKAGLMADDQTPPSCNFAAQNLHTWTCDSGVEQRRSLGHLPQHCDPPSHPCSQCGGVPRWAGSTQTGWPPSSHQLDRGRVLRNSQAGRQSAEEPLTGLSLACCFSRSCVNPVHFLIALSPQRPSCQPLTKSYAVFALATLPPFAGWSFGCPSAVAGWKPGPYTCQRTSPFPAP